MWPSGGGWHAAAAVRAFPAATGTNDWSKDMTERRTDPILQDVHRGLFIAAAAMLLAGSVIGLTGLGLGGAAVIASGRRWHRRVDLPANEIAKLKWEQARAAASAGAGAWRDAEAAGGLKTSP
jgi:hypothetical protein